MIVSDYDHDYLQVYWMSCTRNSQHTLFTDIDTGSWAKAWATCSYKLKRWPKGWNSELLPLYYTHCLTSSDDSLLLESVIWKLLFLLVISWSTLPLLWLDEDTLLRHELLTLFFSALSIDPFTEPLLDDVWLHLFGRQTLYLSLKASHSPERTAWDSFETILP